MLETHLLSSQSRSRVRVSVPNSVAYDMRGIKEADQRGLTARPCTACHSGVSLEFATLQGLVVDAKKLGM